MAKVVESYRAVMTNTGYIFEQPDPSSDKTQYPHGTVLTLSPNYVEKETNGYYKVRAPESGWISYQIVGDITPNYTTSTDACTAPDSLTVSGKVLTINGGAGGDLNTLTGFGVSWRERAVNGTEWGAWSADTVVTSRSVDVSANAGKVRQYRARTMGSAGATYYSGYTICQTLVSGNTAAKTPTIVLPRKNAMTISKTPVVVVNCPEDADGDSMVLKRRVDSGDWADIATVAGGGGTVYDKLPSQTNGVHMVTYRLVDENGAGSDMVNLNIVFSAAEWSRMITAGDVISNETISHVEDIDEMLYAVNIQRLYYDLPTIELPGGVGLFKDWGKQMRAMFDAVNACLVAAGRSAATNDMSADWPNAAMINAIRTKVVSV